jgi:hypothetical protein
MLKFAGIAKPTIEPPIDAIEAINARGITSLKSAIPVLSNLGLAASAPASAISRPAPLTKSKWKGKKPLTIGTNRTPPPTPPRTPTIPIKKLTIKRDNGQTHHATELDPCCELSANAGRDRHIKNMKT